MKRGMKFCIKQKVHCHVNKVSSSCRHKRKTGTSFKHHCAVTTTRGLTSMEHALDRHIFLANKSILIFHLCKSLYESLFLLTHEEYYLAANTLNTTSNLLSLSKVNKLCFCSSRDQQRRSCSAPPKRENIPKYSHTVKKKKKRHFTTDTNNRAKPRVSHFPSHKQACQKFHRYAKCGCRGRTLTPVAEGKSDSSGSVSGLGICRCRAIERVAPCGRRFRCAAIAQ